MKNNEKRPVSQPLTLIDDVPDEWNEDASFSSFQNYFESQTQEILHRHGKIYYDGFWKGLKLSEEQLMIVSKECALWISAQTHQLLAYNPFALQKFHREADLIEQLDSGELIYWCYHGDESWRVLTDPENPRMKIWRHYWLKVMNRTPMAEVSSRPQFGWFELTPSMNNLYGLRLMVKYQVPVLPNEDCDEFATVIAFCKAPEAFRDECRRYGKVNCEYYPVPQIKLMD